MYMHTWHLFIFNLNKEIMNQDEQTIYVCLHTAHIASYIAGLLSKLTCVYICSTNYIYRIVGKFGELIPFKHLAN